MCGICGKVDFSGDTVPADLLVRMCAALVHRGPDAQGIHTAPGVGLAQRRLSIIDLSERAVAPLANEDESVWVTFNGEIYNFAELRQELEGQGHRFRTATDTEVIVHLYEQEGLDFVRRLRGMFSLAIWDAPRRRLIAARDRLGKKPFYYATRPGSFVFASELGALLEDASIPRRPDLRAIDAYLTRQYVPSPLTAFEGISKLAAGHYLICEQGSVQVRRYWAPSDAPTVRRPVDEIAAELLARLREAVRIRLVADVPVGAFLSGGIDSGAVVALMAQESRAPVKTFSIGFEDTAFNELEFARQVAERYATDHHELMVRPDAARVLPDLVRHYGEPFADSSALPTYYVSELARRHVTVALSGDGGDESFAGYENYRAVARWSQYDAVSPSLRKTVGGGITALLGALPYSRPTARMSRGAAMWSGDVPERFRLQSSIFKPEEKLAAYTPAFRHAIATAPGSPIAEPAWRAGEDPLDWMMRHDQLAYLPDCLMVKTDIASMMHSLEVRCPLLDSEVVQFAATIPSDLKQRDGTGKWIFKYAVRDLLPDAILNKPKTGFGVPLARWFREDLYQLVREVLLDARARGRGLFRPAFVDRIILEHYEGRHDWSARLWALLFLELWFREFID